MNQTWPTNERGMENGCSVRNSKFIVIKTLVKSQNICCMQFKEALPTRLFQNIQHQWHQCDTRDSNNCKRGMCHPTYRSIRSQLPLFSGSRQASSSETSINISIFKRAQRSYGGCNFHHFSVCYLVGLQEHIGTYFVNFGPIFFYYELMEKRSVLHTCNFGDFLSKRGFKSEHFPLY